MLLLLLFVSLLHRHDGADGICDVLAASMLHYPLMRIVGYGIPPRLAFHGRATCSCVTCLVCHVLTPFQSILVLRPMPLQSYSARQYSRHTCRLQCCAHSRRLCLQSGQAALAPSLGRCASLGCSRPWPYACRKLFGLFPRCLYDLTVMSRA